MDLERQVRILQVTTGVLSLALAVLVASAFQSQKQRLRELDVERINIIEPDGKLRMTISNKELVPDPVINGKTFVGARKGARSAGIIFFNDEGDECGGLAFTGKQEAGKAQAGGDLIFDQFHQDQTVGIAYSQSGERRSAGLHVWDRPLTPVSELVEKMQAIEKMPAGPEKTAEQEEFKQAAASGELGAHRLFVGKGPDGSAGLTVADRTGKNRVTLLVDDHNVARLQFLDDKGKVIYSLPPDTK